jgi:hypothetical protein
VSALGRRLTALEALAEQARRREVREMIATLPEAQHLTPAELEAATDEGLRALDRMAALKRQGFTERRVIRMEAERMGGEFGQTVEEVLIGAGLDPADYR